jgi:tetratricopeptide (TPR) repeat protein
MKNAWSRYFPLIVALLLAVSCKNHNKNIPQDADSPIFQSDPALKKITDQIHNTPDNASLYFSRGNILRRMQQDSLALKDYKAAAALDTTKSEYISVIGDLLFENKDIAGSVEWIQKAIAKDPTDVKAHLKIAKMFVYINENAKAFTEIDLVLRKDVYNPEAYFLKGMVYKNLKDTAKAISNFQTAINVNPDYRDAFLQLGVLAIAKKDPLALKYFDNAFAIDSSDVFPIFEKGVYYQNAKDYAQAKEQYRQCIIRSSRFVDAYFNMGYVYMQEDSVEKAYHQYDIVTKIDPRNPTGFFDRGLCLEYMDSIKRAVEDYKMALVLDPNYKSPKNALEKLTK